MDHKIYHGLLKDRKRVEDCLGPILPASATVLFAYGRHRSIPQADGSPDEGQIDILVYWTIDRKFFSAVGQAKQYYDIPTGKYAQTPFQIIDSRMKHEPEDYLATIDDLADAKGFGPEFRAAFRDLFKRMVWLKKRWDESAEDYTFTQDLEDVPPGGLPANGLEPVSEN